MPAPSPRWPRIWTTRGRRGKRWRRAGRYGCCRAGRGGMGADGEVTIAGRVFTPGTAYAPSPGSYGRGPARLLRHPADSFLGGGGVHLALVPSGRRRVRAGTEWAAWAGEPVGD